MFAKIRSDVSAQVSDDVVASALLAAKQAGIDSADRIRATAVAGNRLLVAGITPGYHAVVDVSQPAPPAQETLQRIAQHDKQQALAPQEPQMEQQRNGPTLKT